MGAETSSEAVEEPEPNVPDTTAAPSDVSAASAEPEPQTVSTPAQEQQEGRSPNTPPSSSAADAGHNPLEEVQSSSVLPSRSAPGIQRRRTTALDSHNVGDLAAALQRRPRRFRTWMDDDSPEFSRPANFKDDDELPNPAAPLATEPDPDFSQAGPLSLKTRVEYSAMPKNAMQAVFGLVTVEAAAQSAAQSGEGSEAGRKPMDLVCVLDTSGSMGSRNKLEDLKAAVRFIISESLPSDRVSLVTFQSCASRALRLRRMDREGQDEATVATLRMSAGGGTRIASGLDLGLQVLEQRRHRNKVCAILLLTDGQDNSCRMQLPHLLQRAAKMGCGIYPFGFGEDHDSVLLREVSERAKTPFTFVEETSLVKEAFAGVVAGLSSIVAQQVQVTLRCHARLKEVNTPFEVQRHDDRSALVTIPDIFAEERRDILVELEVPADDVASETVLLEASAHYVAVRETAEVRVQTPVVTMSVQRVDEPQPEQEPDEEVFEQRQRWEVTQCMEEASRRSDRGDFEEARRLLSTKRQTLRDARKSRTTEALTTELEDAESRMRNFGTWTVGSHEVRDATMMHQMQRTTNTMTCSSFRGEAKSSKSLYVSSIQSERIRRSTVAYPPSMPAEGTGEGDGKGGKGKGRSRAASTYEGPARTVTLPVSTAASSSQVPSDDQVQSPAENSQ